MVGIKWKFSKCRIDRIDKIDKIEKIERIEKIDLFDPTDPTLRKKPLDPIDPLDLTLRKNQMEEINRPTFCHSKNSKVKCLWTEWFNSKIKYMNQPFLGLYIDNSNRMMSFGQFN